MVNSESLKLPLVLRDAIKSVQMGREVLLRYFGNLSKIEQKYQAGLVSEADRESESVIRSHLLSKYPDFEFLGEESYASGDTLDLNLTHTKARWILDPLDGTTNYIHRFPIFCISLGDSRAILSKGYSTSEDSQIGFFKTFGALSKTANHPRKQFLIGGGLQYSLK